MSTCTSSTFTSTILSNLNASQSAAVTSEAQALAILAGPGSGKTHTLTSRTAWLLKHEGLQPWNIIVATFTVKAAREMKERIGKLIGDGMEKKIILGTFHSIARRYLARYGHLIGIQKDFGIADTGDSLAIVKRIAKRHELTIDSKVARSRISSRKAQGTHFVPPQSKDAAKQIDIQQFEICYTEYEEALKRSNLLDYDDLLLRCVDLLRAHPSCVSNVEAVLIDEFQDTNLVQFDLMRLFAAHKKRVTIVGDPDQSIYGFRSAETKNFKRMLRQYPGTITIPLEENYRSSGCILYAALEVIMQDTSRISKTLKATHTVGTQPVLRKLSSAFAEAHWLVLEIKRCLALTGDLMSFDDVAILLRSASLSRHIESALGKAGIPYRMVGGHRFYDRVEVKIILDYLRVINQPDNNDALARIVNVPSRRIGDVTIKALLEEADQRSITLWRLSLDIVQGNITAKTKLAKQTDQGLSQFINIILTIRRKMSDTNSSMSTTDLINMIMDKIDFEDHLKKTHSDDHETRMANVQELINLASDFTSQLELYDDDDEALPEVEGLEQETLSNPLSKFLANIALASDVKATDEEAPKAQVTISTIHAAKGLEWPVVFIPAAYRGSIPHSRSDDDNEERRLLYVAMTRAKALLYMSFPKKNSQREDTMLSPFLEGRSLGRLLSNKGPSFSPAVTQDIARILRRPQPLVNFETAAQYLESLEDDILGVGDDEDDEAKWRDADGSHHYTQGQPLPKRRRLEEGSNFVGSEGPRQTWRPSYSTTMTESSGYSTSSMTLSSGFISAGSHFQALSEQLVNCVAEKSRIEPNRGSGSKLQTRDEPKIPKPAKTITARTTRRVEGQSSISAFFTARSTNSTTFSPISTTATSRIPDPKPNVQSGAEQSAFSRSYSSGRTNLNQASSSCSTILTPAIDPSLSSHRIGPATLLPPARQWHEEGDGAKPTYIFLSSSPQQRAKLVEEAVEEPLVLNDLPPESRTVEGVYTTKMQAGRPRPIPSMHMTTMGRMNTLNAPPPKALGMRRTMNGWGDRKNISKGFVPPRMARPP